MVWDTVDSSIYKVLMYSICTLTNVVMSALNEHLDFSCHPLMPSSLCFFVMSFLEDRAE